MWKTVSVLLCAVLILLTLGFVMLASTSEVHGYAVHGDSLFYIKRQAVWLALGIVTAVCASFFDYRWWRPAAVPLAIAVGLLLAAVLVFGPSIQGSARWFRVGGFSIQPSELAKFAVVVVLSWWMARVQRYAHEFMKGFLVPLGALSFILLLIFLAPDFGTTLLVALVGFSIMLVAQSNLRYLLTAALLGGTGFILAVMHNAVRMRRITAFLNPERYADAEAYQLLNAIYAFVIGGSTGVGLGQSLQKHQYLPEAHTDFIYAIIGEEWGLPASMLVLLLFTVFFVCGLRISLGARDNFGRLLAFGITMMIALQAVINMGVVTGCLPTKGLPLPFISYGGSSLVVTLGMTGVLLNVARVAAEEGGPETEAIKDRYHR